jgi:hypothetical protein
MRRTILAAVLLALAAAVAVPACGEPLAVVCAAGATSLVCGTGVCRVLVPACDDTGALELCVPGEPGDEICNDGLDNDCDGLIDEDCVCTADSFAQSCYGGAPAERFHGLCQRGVQMCEGGAWGSCEGEILPVPEICGDGLDNDCDGVIDDGCSCAPGQEVPCYGSRAGTLGHGACHAGTQRCDDDGRWGACEEQVLPHHEICDGFDNDCDGVVGNGSGCCVGVPQPCWGGTDEARNKGSCHDGAQFCVGGQYSLCMDQRLPRPELCNGLDDDCNGKVDDGAMCCSDQLKDGTESDVDCGGLNCERCAPGQGCNTDGDCLGGACLGGLCQ